MRKTVYVGMALTQAPIEFRTIFHDALKKSLREITDVEILDFFWVSNGITAGEDIEVFELDEQHSQNADLFLAITDHPSIGLGMEIMIRSATGKASLFCAHGDSRITRMLLGYLKKTNQEMFRYESVEDVVVKVKQCLNL